jgi:hypothetical protein
MEMNCEASNDIARSAPNNAYGLETQGERQEALHIAKVGLSAAATTATVANITTAPLESLLQEARQKGP